MMNIWISRRWLLSKYYCQARWLSLLSGNIVFFVALYLSFCLHLFSSVEWQSPKSNESQPGQVYPIHQDSIIRLLNLLVVAWGVGGTPYDSLYGGAPPKRSIFFRLQVYERVGISLVGVYKRGGKSVIWVCEGPRRACRWILWLCKVEKMFYCCDWFLCKRQCIYSS